MAAAKKKTDDLSVGAKTLVYEMARAEHYGYDSKRGISTKEMQKGLIVEPEAIKLLNDVDFTSWKKNTERKTNEWITGECDIFTGTKIHDIKSVWSINSFPAIPEKGEDSGYEWQMRGYMMLWNVEEAEVDYVLIDTPDELLGFEDPAAHYFSHIDPVLRITRVAYKRDLYLEEFIRFRVEAAQKYYQEVTNLIKDSHK